MNLIAKQIWKTYADIAVLRGVSLSAAPGEAIAILGRSGEGKTTLLHIFGTLEKPDRGTLEIGGKPGLPHSLLRSLEIGFIFQAYSLLEDFTTIENVLMPARIARQAADRKKGLELLKLVGLEEKADLPAKFLSGGERQRTAIARALCNDPSLLLADEPTGNLDRANAEKIGSLLLSLVKERNKTLLLVTHDTKLAALCDRRFLLNEGILTPQG
jgi:lipoprotein-releasing system ATP-binding protein